MALSLAFGPSIALAKSKAKSQDSVSGNALNLDFSSANSSTPETKSELDMFTEDAYLDAEFAAADVKTKRKSKQKAKLVNVAQVTGAQLTDSETANDIITIIENPNNNEIAATNTKAVETKSNTQASIVKKAKKSTAPEVTAVASTPAATTTTSTVVTTTAATSSSNLTGLSGTSSAQLPEVTTQKKTKVINMNLAVMRSTSLYNFGDGSDMQSMDYSLSGSYRLNNLYKVSAGLDASQDLKDDQNSDLAGGRIGFSRKALELSKVINLTPSIGIRIPVNKNQLDRESLMFGTSASGRFDINPEVLFSENFSIGMTLSLSKNFHQYTTSTLGSVNTEYSSLQGIDLGYSLTDSLSISAAFNHSNRLSYDGVLRESFEMSQEVAYQFSEGLGAMVGHVNGGSVFKADGETSNIQPIDENNSIVYGGMSLSF